IIDLAALEAALRDDTVIVASMLVNNELGTIMPIKEIAGLLARRYGSASHRHAAAGIVKPALVVDASQALPHMPVRPNDLCADLLILDAAKIFGPKRTG